LNNTLLNDQWVIEEIKKFRDSSEKEDTTYQNLRDTGKSVLRRKFIATSSHIRKFERSQINNLITGIKLLEKQEQASSRRNNGKRLQK
jgi:hypothetical protein